MITKSKLFEKELRGKCIIKGIPYLVITKKTIVKKLIKLKNKQP